MSTSGRPLLDVSALDSLVKPTFKKLLPILLKNKINVAICTYTDRLMNTYDSQPGLAGEDLVVEVIKRAFPCDYLTILDKIYICAWFPSYSIIPIVGKNNHIARAWLQVLVRQKLDDPNFTSYIRNSTVDYWNIIYEHNKGKLTTEEIEKLKSKTVLIDDDYNNILLAKKQGYNTLFINREHGIEDEDWNNFIQNNYPDKK